MLPTQHEMTKWGRLPAGANGCGRHRSGQVGARCSATQLATGCGLPGATQMGGHQGTDCSICTNRDTKMDNQQDNTSSLPTTFPVLGQTRSQSQFWSLEPRAGKSWPQWKPPGTDGDGGYRYRHGQRSPTATLSLPSIVPRAEPPASCAANLASVCSSSPSLRDQNS